MAAKAASDRVEHHPSAPPPRMEHMATGPAAKRHLGWWRVAGTTRSPRNSSRERGVYEAGVGRRAPPPCDSDRGRLHCQLSQVVPPPTHHVGVPMEERHERAPT